MGALGSNGRGKLVDYYAALGVAEDASVREVEAAYWREAQRTRQALPLLNEAYEVLGHAERRADYDARRAAAGRPAPERRAEPPATPNRRGRLHEFLG